MSKISHEFLWLLGAAGMIATGCLSQQGEGNEMTTIPVRTSITVSSPAPMQLVVVVRVSNVSDRDVFLLKDPPSLFVTADGHDIAEIGPSEKRKPYTLADYERVPPGRTTERRQNVAALFAWKPGTHTYEVSVTGNYTDPTDGRSWKAPRVAAEFVWTR